jgi:hypothetical protein
MQPQYLTQGVEKAARHQRNRPCVAHIATKKVILQQNAGTNLHSTAQSARHKGTPSRTVLKEANRTQRKTPLRVKTEKPGRTRKRRGERRRKKRTRAF